MINSNEIAQSYWIGDNSFTLKDNLYSTVFIIIAELQDSQWVILKL